MMKFKYLICLLLTFCLVVGFYPFSPAVVSAENLAFSEISIEDGSLQEINSAFENSSFADDRVLLVMNQEASLNFYDYQPEDFNEVPCASVTDITRTVGEMVKEKKEAMEKLPKGEILGGHYIEIPVENFRQILCLELIESGHEKVLEAIEILGNRDDVLYAQPDFVISVCSTVPNDPYYYYDSTYNQWGHEKIQLPDAWDITTGSSSVIVGVADSGIDGSHIDLSSQVDVAKSRDFTSGVEATVSTVTDPLGHGTHVAGIIGAKGNNGIGVAGVCWNVTLVSLRVFDSAGYGYSSYLALAIAYATSQNIKLLNFSGRWYSGNTYYDLAVNTSISNYTGLFVCAAGNENLDNDLENIYPANYSFQNMITVGASTADDQRWVTDDTHGSNYGQNNVDIFAPGHNILNCVPDDSIDFLTGTSMATPYVTGVAALLLANNPRLSPSKLKHIILHNVDVVYDQDENDVFGDLCVSGGRLNAYKALTHSSTQFTHTDLGVLSGHQCYCTDCDYSYVEGHDWQHFPRFYSCSICGARTNAIPVPFGE